MIEKISFVAQKSNTKILYQKTCSIVITHMFHAYLQFVPVDLSKFHVYYWLSELE